MKAIALTILGACCLAGCAKTTSTGSDSTPVQEAPAQMSAPFDADSAYSFIARQVEFGPRVPGTAAHTACGDWLEQKLRETGCEVIVQRVTLHAFDGTPLPARNIFARFNPQAADRTLLLAHWDTRPWADNDPDSANHSKPVPGANDGASGVGVLLEVARQLNLAGSDKGIDILFTDAEDYGSDGDEDSWALGTRYFAENPPVAGYAPKQAVLLDMVGGAGSIFTREYFSNQYAPALLDDLWASARATGNEQLFSNTPGGAITDDHLELLKVGIPTVDIIGFSPDGGFLPTWHTLRDDMTNISRETLQAVGTTLMHWLSK